MKSHGSPVGLLGLRLMESSPTSPTTLEGGTSGTTQAETPDAWRMTVRHIEEMAN
jgi:hypothetical protein